MANDGVTDSRNAGVDDDPVTKDRQTATVEHGGPRFCNCAACQSGFEVRLTPTPNAIARYVTGASLPTVYGTATAEEMALQLRREVNDIWWAVAGLVAVAAFLVIVFRVRH